MVQKVGLASANKHASSKAISLYHTVMTNYVFEGRQTEVFYCIVIFVSEGTLKQEERTSPSFFHFNDVSACVVSSA